MDDREQKNSAAGANVMASVSRGMKVKDVAGGREMRSCNPESSVMRLSEVAVLQNEGRCHRDRQVSGWRGDGGGGMEWWRIKNKGIVDRKT